MTRPRSQLSLHLRIAITLIVAALTGVLFASGAGCGGSDVAPLNSTAASGAGAAGGAGAGAGGTMAGGGASTSAGSSGAGSSGAGSSGAGSSGAGSSGGSTGTPSGGASGCTGTPHKLCEDFESGSIGAIPTSWTAFKGYGAGSAQDAVLATDQSHSGKMSLKSSSMATGQGRIQKSLSTLGATASKHWGRIFYKVQSPATKPASGVLHVTWVGLLGSSENRVVDIVENTDGAHQWLYNNPDDMGSVGSSYDWVFDAAWHCAEWYVDVSAKQYRFFSDSSEVTAIGFSGKGDAQMSNYSSVLVGATFYQMPPTPFVVWFDDLAIDDTRIGCE